MSVCRKNFFFLFAALFLCLLALPHSVRAVSGNDRNQGVRAGVFNFEGYHSKDDAGRLEGYGIDLLNLLSQYSHLNFIPEGFEKSWQDMQDMLRDGKIDIVSSARRTPVREKDFVFSLPVGRNHTMLAKKMHNTWLAAGDYSTYNGIKIGAVRGSSQNAHLENFARNKGFTYTLVEYDSPAKMTEALQNGDVDAILSSNLRKPVNEILLDIINSDNFYIIARKEDQALIDEINYAIEQLNLNEGDWQNDLYYRHYGPEKSDTLEFTEREEDYIANVTNGNTSITVIGRDNMVPYSYVEDGKLKGILLDYFDKAMQVANLPYKAVAPQNTEEYKKLADNMGVTVVLDRLEPSQPEENSVEYGLATEPYLVTGLARVTRVDFNKPVESLALPRTPRLDFPASLLQGRELKYYPTSEDAMEAVQQGEADAAYVLPYAAQMYINRQPGSDLFYTMLQNGGANFRLFLSSQADHELITILKKAMKQLPAGILNQLAANYVSVNAEDMSLYQYLHANPETMLAVALCIMLVATLMTIMWLRGKWNRQLLATTEHANQELEGQLAIVEALSRDYSNVLAIDAEKGNTNFVKIADNGAAGKTDNGVEEIIYSKILENYVRQKVHPEDRQYVAKALSLDNVRTQLEQKEEYTGTYRVQIKGKVHHFQFTFVKPRGSDQVSDNLILVGFRNIDDVIKREQEQKKALAAALAKSRYASAAKTAFLNNMSHDIRTPMNAIIGFTTLATSNVDKPAMVKRYLGKIMTSGNHLLSLINDVLDMSRIESGKVKIEEQEVRLPDILHDLRTIALADVRAKQLDFQIDILNVVNETIFCDRLRLNQILLNILSNAMKYTHPGGKVEVRVIQTGLPVDGRATYEFHVRDSGIGMSREFLKHVFEPFEREQTTTVSGIQGTGLGLAITKNIVDMMGGTIEVESEQGKGSEFTAIFQFRVLEDEAAKNELTQYVGKRALVVDDDVNTCTSLGKMLSELGLRPDWTTLGKEALVRTEFANEQKDGYDVYLIDWVMADMNGIELVRRLRKTVPASVPIIILTAYDWTDVEEEGKEAGVTAFCSKPLFLSELKTILSGIGQQISKEIQSPPDVEQFVGKHILLAEDNEMNQEIAQMILEDAGFTVDIVENGQLALDTITEKSAGTYDLILMDVQMPIMNGYDATKAIRGLDDPLKSAIPIVAMTANAFDEDREEAINSGMNGYIPKPIDMKTLFETLARILESQQE